MNYFITPLCICTLFLLMIVVNSYNVELELKKLESIVREAADKGDIINDVIKLDKGGKIDQGGLSIVWRGIYLKETDSGRIEIPAAIKFSLFKHVNKRECEILYALDANNIDVEKYGILSLYYNGTAFGDHEIMAITLLQNTLVDSFNKYGPLLPENQLRIFFQLVMTIKYMHNKGVIHNDLKPDNIMYRDGNIFIIDFDCAERINGPRIRSGGTSIYASPVYFKKLPRYYIDDFKTLYYTLSVLAGINLPWEFQRSNEEITKSKLEQKRVRGFCDDIRNTALKSMYEHLHDSAFVPYPVNLKSINVDKRVPKYILMLTKALKGIFDITGSKITSIDWFLEDVIRPPKPQPQPVEQFTENPIVQLENAMKMYANKSHRIGGKVIPTQNNKLWTILDWVSWHGTLKDDIEVEIKAGKETLWLAREYKCYQMMGAVNNKSVEMYGIQSAYDFVKFPEKYAALVLTFCPERLVDKTKNISSVNILRVLYQAIFTLKFVHGKGLLHQTLTPNEFLIRGSRLYISGFIYAELNRVRYCNSPLGSEPNFGAVTTTLIKNGSFMDDLKSLYYIMLYILGIELPWFKMENIDEIIKLKIKYYENRDLCNKISDPIVRRVLLEYYEKVMPIYKNEYDINIVQLDDRIPEYNTLGNLALNGIEEISKSRDPHFDWSSNIPTMEMPSIESIDDPKKVDIYLNRIF